MLPNPADHLAIDEGADRRIAQFQLDAPLLLHHLDVEVAMAHHHLAAVVLHVAAVEHCQGATPQQFMQAAQTGVTQARHFHLGKDFQTAFRGNQGINPFRFSGPMCVAGQIQRGHVELSC